jgi:hypothetical protein
MRGLVRRIGAGEFENPGDDLGRERCAAGLALLVAQQVLDPSSSYRARCIFVPTIAIADNGEQTLAIFSRRKDAEF